MKKLRIKALAAIITVAFIIPIGCGCEPGPAPTPPQIPPSTPVADPEPSLPPVSASDAVNVYVFDVGEALSVFIDDGETEVLIDGGNHGGKRTGGGTVAEFIKGRINDGALEYVIATHSDADHIGGLDNDIYGVFQVKHTIYGDTGTSNQYKEFWAAASGEPDSELYNDIDEVTILSEGVTLSVFDILDDMSNTNNNSVISLLDCYGRKLLVTGDAEDYRSKTVRNALTAKLRGEGVSDIDVYIVGHHGSETSSSAELLALIRPEYAVISSAGPDHRDKNPDPSVLRRLTEVNAGIYATYISGDIVIMFDNNGIKLSPPVDERIMLSD
jgi:beta-lactamase superfamily II metal-dependent hydrolase